jgi:hypothetical protein
LGQVFFLEQILLGQVACDVLEQIFLGQVDRPKYNSPRTESKTYLKTLGL